MTSAGDPCPGWALRLLERALEQVPSDVAEAVRRQAALATVVAEVEGRSLDVAVQDHAVPVDVADGPLRPVASVTGPTGQPTGELLVWVRGGRFLGLERPWWTDDAPERWPAPEDVRGPLGPDAAPGDLGTGLIPGHPAVP